MYMCPGCLELITKTDMPTHAPHAPREPDGTIRFPHFSY